MWHPVGIFTEFSLKNWMENDIFASEARENFFLNALIFSQKPKRTNHTVQWNFEVCWLDNTTVAIWGDCSEYHEAAAILKGYNVNTGNKTEVDVFI